MERFRVHFPRVVGFTGDDLTLLHGVYDSVTDTSCAVPAVDVAMTHLNR